MAYRSDSALYLFLIRCTFKKLRARIPSISYKKKFRKGRFLCQNFHSAKSFGGKICQWPIDQIQSLYL